MRLVALFVASCGVVGCGRHHFDPLADAVAGDVPDPVACVFTFCDDFDREGPADRGWTSVRNTGGALLALDTVQAASPPNSFLVTLPATQLESGFLEKQLPLATTSVRIELALAYASQTPGSAEIDLVQLQWQQLPAPCTSFGYFLVRDGTGPFDLQETYGGCGGNEDTTFDTLDNTGFHDIILTVTFGPIGTAAIRVDVDGTPRVDKLTSHAIEPSELTLSIGGGAVRDVGAAWELRYDDLIVDVQ